jgi:ribonuclease HI
VIYTLITDAMHAGLEDNPLFPGTAREGGYTFKSRANVPGKLCSGPVRVNSAGYADDAALVATDPARLAEMHAWMREFFGAHCFAFNVKKTKLLCSNPETAPPLYSVDGGQVVEPLPAGTDVRYLGLGINLRLDWKGTHVTMERAVLGLAERIRRHAMDIPMATMATKQVLIPRLRSGLLFAKVPESRLEKWDGILRRAVFQGSNTRTCAGLAIEALYLTSGFPRLSDHAWALRAEEVMVTLNAEYPSSATAWARMGGVLWGVGHHMPPSKCRVVRHVAGVPGAEVFETDAADRAPGPDDLLARCRPLREEEVEEWGRRWRPVAIPTLCRVGERQGPGVGRCMTFYTDGSTGPDRGLPSGSSVVRADEDGQAVGVHGFAVRTSGNNYLAELVAFAAALIQTPVDTDSVTWSDALSVKHAAERGRDRSDDGSLLRTFHLTQRQRILSAARPVMNIVRAVISARAGASDIRHVRAHTGGADVHSQLNEVADVEANRARIEAAATGEFIPYLLAGEERVCMSVNGVSVIGSYRRQVLRAAAGRALARLASMPSQGLLAGHGGRFTSYCTAVAKTRSPHLIRFATLAIAEWLPCEKVCWNKARESDNLGRGQSCKLCGEPVESVRHVLCDCQAAGLPAVRTRAMSRARDLAEGRILAPASGKAAAAGEGLEWRGRGLLIPAWFDPSGEASFRVPPGTSQRTITSVRSYDPLAGLLGILPPGLDELLTWEQVGPVHGGLWRRRQLGCIKSMGEEIRRALMWVGVCVWSARCRAMDEWWSDGGAVAVRARADLHAEIGRRAHRKAAKAAAKGPVVSRRKPGALLQRQKVGKRTLDALRAAPTSVAANRPRRPPRRCSRDGFFVSFGADADAASDEALERAVDKKLHGGAWY